MSPEVVSDILGHASVAITGDIYGHVSPDVSREAAAKLAAALSEQGSAANGGHQWRSDPNLEAFQDHVVVYFVALTRGNDGGSKQDSNL